MRGRQRGHLWEQDDKGKHQRRGWRDKVDDCPWVPEGQVKQMICVLSVHLVLPEKHIPFGIRTFFLSPGPSNSFSYCVTWKFEELVQGDEVREGRAQSLTGIRVLGTEGWAGRLRQLTPGWFTPLITRQREAHAVRAVGRGVEGSLQGSGDPSSLLPTGVKTTGRGGLTCHVWISSLIG